MMRWYMEFTSPHDFWPSLKNLAHYKYQADGRQLLLAITLHHRIKPRVCNRCRKLLLSASRSRLADFFAATNLKVLQILGWEAVMIFYKVFCFRKLGCSPLTIDYFCLFSTHFSRRRRRWDWFVISRRRRVRRLIFSNGWFVAARQQDSDHNHSLRNRFL